MLTEFNVVIDGTTYPITAVRLISEDGKCTTTHFRVIVRGKTLGLRTEITQTLLDDLATIGVVNAEEEVLHVMKEEVANEIKRYVESL
jgi:hypothetical protein